MEVRLPDDKVARIRQSIDQWLPKKKATKCEILSLVGLLQHATSCVLWQDLCEPHVFDSCQTQEIRLLHHIKQGILLRPIVVAHLFSVMEWS